MKRIKFILMMALVLLLSSCGKTNLTEITFKPDGDNLYAYKDGEVFSGDAWSSDGETLKVHCNTGVVEQIVAYHSNGQCAVIASPGQVDYYDESGQAISKKDAAKEFPDLIRKIQAVAYEMGDL